MGEDLNIINQWGEPQKGGDQILKVQWGWGVTIFELNLVGEKPCRKLWNTKVMPGLIATLIC